MKIFSFLKDHKVSFLIALVLLFAQANCELTLPGLMSDIVDVGIGQGGIASVVPDTIRADDLADLELFLTQEEAERVDTSYSPAADGIRTFTGDGSVRNDLEGFVGQAEMVAYQLDQGVSTDAVLDAMPALYSTGTSPEAVEGTRRQAEELLGDTVDMEDVAALAASGAIARDDLVQMRESLVGKLGDTGESMVESRAIAYVEAAYERAGVDLHAVQTGYLLRQGATMLGFALLSALCAILSALNASRTSAAIGRDLRHRLYERVLDYSPAEMNRFSAASLITRATNDIQQIQMITVMCLRIVLFAPCMGIGAVVRVLTTPTGMEWILVVAIAVIAIAIGVLMGVTLPKFKIMQSLVDRNNLIAREILTGIMPIRAFGRQRHEEERYDEANRELTRTSIFTNRCMALLMPVMMIVMNTTTVGIVWFGAQGVDAGSLQVGTLMAYINYVMQVIMSFMILTMISVMLPRAGVAADRVQEVLDTPTSICDPDPARHVTREDGVGWRGVVSFHDVTFSYPGADAPTLEHVSFTVEPGKTLAVIGSTGCGKSTLVQLIPRLYDVTHGSVTLDDVDIRDIDLAELRRVIGYVPQQRMLFSGTIESNIKFGDEAMDDADMVRAARIAQAEEFIGAKPDGYESPISQGGSNVSGGQNQRISIARALAIRPKVLVFDDSFSALDYKTDAALRAELGRSCSDAAVIIVAQRIATIMHADEILVLDDGRIVGRGTHGELLRACPEYLEIAKSQLSASELGLAEASTSPAEGAATDGMEQEGGER